MPVSQKVPLCCGSHTRHAGTFWMTSPPAIWLQWPPPSRAATEQTRNVRSTIIAGMSTSRLAQLVGGRRPVERAEKRHQVGFLVGAEPERRELAVASGGVRRRRGEKMDRHVEAADL